MIHYTMIHDIVIHNKEPSEIQAKPLITCTQTSLVWPDFLSFCIWDSVPNTKRKKVWPCESTHKPYLNSLANPFVF